jgi:hypothetical protein
MAEIFVIFLKSFQAVPEYYIEIRRVFLMSAVFEHSLYRLIIIRSLIMLYRPRFVAAGKSMGPWCVRVELY